MNVIDSNKLEHDVVRKPLRTFRHHALEWVASIGKDIASTRLKVTIDVAKAAALAWIKQHLGLS